MTVMPSVLQISGIQSTNVMWIVDPLRAECEKTAASRKRKKPRENCAGVLGELRAREGMPGMAYHGSAEIYASCPHVGVVDPCWGWELVEETI